MNTEMRPVQIFVFITVIFALISTLFSAYYACFGAPTGGFTRILDLVIEIFFALDIARNFLMQYVDPEEQKTVKNLKMIGKRYLKGVFIVDVLAFSPFFLRSVVEDSWDED